MARIFAGTNRKQIDADVLRGLQSLPDDFWVFAEFNLRRNVDWFVVRPNPDGASSLIAIESKRTRAALWGEINATWRRLLDDGTESEYMPAGPFRNPYWQAVEVAHNLKDWLWNHQAVFRASVELLPPEAFRVWPDVLILSPPGMRHRLPQRPDTKFGQFFFDVESLLHHLVTWDPRPFELVALSEQDMLQLVELLNLTPLSPDTMASDLEETGVALEEQNGDIARQALAALERREALDLRLLGELEAQRVANTQLRKAIERLCARLERLASPGSPGPDPSTATASLDLASRARVASAIADYSQGSATRSVPAVERTAQRAIDGILTYIQKNATPDGIPATDVGHWLKQELGINAKADLGLALGDVLKLLAEARLVVVRLDGSMPFVSPAE